MLTYNSEHTKIFFKHLRNMVYIFLFNESIYCQQTTKRGGRGFFKRKISLDQTKQNQERMKQTRKGKYVTKLKEKRLKFKYR